MNHINHTNDQEQLNRPLLQSLQQTQSLRQKNRPSKPWLASLLLRRGRTLLPRFAYYYRRIARLSRHGRQRLAQRLALGLTGTALALALSRAPVHAATITVADGEVAISANGRCSLREAIINANNDARTHPDCPRGSGADVIELPDHGTFTLTDVFATYFGPTGLPPISSKLTIQGHHSTIARDASAPNLRLLAVTSTGDLTLNQLTLSGGRLRSDDGAAILNFGAGRLTITHSTLSDHHALDGSGGAVEQFPAGQFIGSTEIHYSTITGNSANDGGAVESAGGSMTITYSTLSNNEAQNRGGAVVNFDGDLTITYSTLKDNASHDKGGGLYNREGTATVTYSTLSGNTANDGGGVHNTDEGTVIIYRSTLSENVADRNGGGVVNYSAMTITDSTLNGNRSHSGGGAANSGRLTISSSVFSSNEANFIGGGVDNAARAHLSVTNTAITANTADSRGAGIHNYGTATISSSTLSGNTVSGRGGGLYNRRNASMTITNSTLSGNTAGVPGGGQFDGGGGAFNAGVATFNNATLSRNTAGSDGGGGLQNFGVVTFNRSLVSGNMAATGREVFNATTPMSGTINANNYNLFGYDNNAGVVGFTPGATDIIPAEPLANILDTTLQNNGGTPVGYDPPQIMETHALIAGSSAVDGAPSAACVAAPVNDVDQRGEPRNVDGNASPSSNECDVGAFELQTAVPLTTTIFVSTETAGNVAGIDFSPADVLAFDGSNWSLFFDGSAHGLIDDRHNTNAIYVPDPTEDALYLSFAQNKVDYFPALGQVFGQDILYFDGSDFAWYFDGSDVGLTALSEKLDGLHILDGSLSPIGENCQAYLLLSTRGDGRVRGYDGHSLPFRGEDILGFCLTSAGESTDGFWHKVLDGSAEGMPRNATVSLSASDDGQTIYLTTKGAFNVDTAAGTHSMVYKFDRITGTFSGPHFVAADTGLLEQVDALHVEGDLP